MHHLCGAPPAPLLGTDAALPSVLIDKGPMDRFAAHGALGHVVILSWLPAFEGAAGPSHRQGDGSAPQVPEGPQRGA